MATILEEQLKLWHERNYGPDIDVPGTFRHLLEEVGELAEALLTGDHSKIWEEAGDVGVLLFHVLRGACPQSPCGAPSSLWLAMAEALDKCERREHRRSSKSPKATNPSDRRIRSTRSR